MSVKLRIISAFCLSIFVLIITGLYSYKSAREYKSASEWVNHTQTVITEMENILSDIQGIESAQRGYVITGNEKYLAPFEKDQADAQHSFSSLRKLVNDNASQGKLLDSIRRLVNHKVIFIRDVVAMRKEQDFDIAQELVKTDRGQNAMDSIRLLSDRFITHERTLLSERLVSEKANFSSTVFVIVISILLAIVIVLTTMYFFIHDYNSRIRSEKQVQESESRLKKFMEILPIGVYILRADRSSYFENIQFKQFFAPENDPDHTYPAYYTGTDTEYPPERYAMTRALNGEKNIFIDDMEIDRDGVRIPLRINATSVTNEEGRIEYAIAVIEDISDSKENEKKLIEARTIAEQSAQLKEAFLANMSHEIRTPMNAIIGFTDLLIRRNLQPQEQEYVQMIRSSGENLLRIINDILDVSKIDSGMMTFEEHPIDISELFGSIRTMMSEKARTKGLSLSFETEQNVPQTVLGDPTRLTQIIINLIGNAIKFTHHGAVNCSARLLQEESDLYRVEFTIRDTGIGIPADKLNSIFERFRQAEAHTTRNYGGTGLGLSIAKQLVELQGGQIRINSTLGLGSVFTFVLPFKKTTEVKAGRQKHSREPLDATLLGQLELLLVEDNPVNIKFICSLFGEYGIGVDVAENGRIAVEMLREKEYDMVLMDMEMPEMNGYEATTVIRSELKKQVPIIAMTAHAMAGEREKCLQLGMNEYISKPVRADLLFEKMLGLAGTKIVSPAEATVAGEAPITNLDFLVTSMRGQHKAIYETLQVFLTQAADDIAALQEAMDSNDLDGIKTYAHRMRSTVGLMGIEVMEILLQQMEALASAGSGMAPLRGLHAALLKNNTKAVQEIEAAILKYRI